jgi:hypothetical protein
MLPVFLSGLVQADLGSDIGNAIANGMNQFFSSVMNHVGSSISGMENGMIDALAPLVTLVGNTPLGFTTENPVVHSAWVSMVGVTDAFLGLYVIVKLIQMMYGQATGAIHQPLGQFVPKVILTVILIHASSFLGTEIILIVNALCGLVLVHIEEFIRQVNGGQAFDTGQTLGLSAVLALVFAFGLVRFILQAVKRIIFFNVLFVLSGPAFLMSLDVQTAPWFQFWLRLYMVTALTQFFQFLTFGLGFQFILATGQTGVTGFVLAIALINLTTEVPTILARFSGAYSKDVPGLEDLVRGAVTAAALLA